MRKLISGALFALLLLSAGPMRAENAVPSDATEQHFLYVAAPGIRNDLRYGGAGILVFDIDHGHKFVRRIETPASRETKPDNMKGVCANAGTRSSTSQRPKNSTALIC